MTPGAEDASRQAVKRLCDEFAVSDAAREVDLLVQFELHMASSYEVTHLQVKEIRLSKYVASSYLMYAYRSLAGHVNRCRLFNNGQIIYLCLLFDV